MNTVVNVSQRSDHLRWVQHVMYGATKLIGCMLAIGAIKCIQQVFNALLRTKFFGAWASSVSFWSYLSSDALTSVIEVFALTGVWQLTEPPPVLVEARRSTLLRWAIRILALVFVACDLNWLLWYTIKPAWWGVFHTWTTAIPMIVMVIGLAAIAVSVRRILKHVPQRSLLSQLEWTVMALLFWSIFLVVTLAVWRSPLAPSWLAQLPVSRILTLGTDIVLVVAAIGLYRLGQPVIRLGAGHCPRCSYDLRGTIGRGCSECGWGRGADPEKKMVAQS